MSEANIHNKHNSGLLRQRGPHEHARVTDIELFFDLVFVFAVTQLSHTLLKQLTPVGALQTGLLFLAVWWVWIYTSWITNWLDPERASVRLMLFVLMLAGLVLSASLPKAFSSEGLLFAAIYVLMQVGRTLFTLWAIRDAGRDMVRNFMRILAWLLLSAIPWIAGGLAGEDSRWCWWVAAMAIDVVSPALGFWTPGLGRSTTADWNVEGGHLAERCSLFIIIALGESILVTGATFAELSWTPSCIAAFVIAFAGSVAMWWIYFNIGARRGNHHISKSKDPGRIARLVYTYIHLLIVGGIIVGAVGDELLLAHPDGHLDSRAIATMVGGPALFLFGNVFFKWLTSPLDRVPLSHLVGLALIAVLLVLLLSIHGLTPLGLSAAMTAILIVVAAWETISLRSVKTQPAA
ncbi:low temperature requirement protein A [Undibacterium sp.]|uniref:low temperature requirement protein A n=1 Tax=Undibacterium sp. TaxID=1914977 RepID=UPI00374DC1D3